jgi:hypothetical protein
MNQDKIKQAFDEWYSKAGSVELNQAWLAAYEWLMSQADKGFLELKEQYVGGYGIQYEVPPEEAWRQARLSCAKELSEKDKRIAELEGELRGASMIARDVLGVTKFEIIYPLAAELASKKESK